MKRKTKKRFIACICTLVILLVSLFLPLKQSTLTASAQVRYNDYIHIQKYDVDMTINEDRTVQVKERINVEFLKKGLTTFYRSLPKESARYYDIFAACNDGKEFSYTVENNPDNGAFIDINCIGAAEKGNIRTYDIAFTMQNGLGAGTKRNGMIIDVIPFGFTVDLHEVSATVRFPFPVTEESCLLYSGYGSETEDTTLNKSISPDGKTLTFSADVLPLAYSERFDEHVAKGVTVDFTFIDGKFQSYTAVRLFTDGTWKILLIGGVCIALAVLALIFTRQKRDIVTTVNLTAPDKMDPMKMGKLLDGTVDNEDVTSMIYYFAHQGYLTIDLQDQNNPELTKRVEELPSTAAPHERTLFNGLFKEGDSVRVTDLQYKFFESVDKAKTQLPSKQMYEKRSVLGFVLGGVIGVLYALGIMQIVATSRLGAHYRYLWGVAFALPVAAILFIGYLQENYRYKWKKRTQACCTIAKIVVAVVFTFICTFLLARHILTEYEKLCICLCAFACAFITNGALSRTEKYLKTLGEILGFKDFIVYTEEDKIQYMLEENPELYYKILPYAQVLGVTDEWEKKFANILIEPPTWCTGTDMDLFDVWLLNRCMRSAFVVAMARSQSKGGGGFIGGSGGGGSFGGFGGGGFGGGGGGAR